MFASTVIGPVSFTPAPAQPSSQPGHQADGVRQVGEPGKQDSSATASEEAAQGKVAKSDTAQKPNGETLSEEELRLLEELKTTDREVRQHELAHQIAGGQYTGAASYQYERGPDGQRYAVAGEVPIDYGPVPGDARATIDKMQQVISAALAPADPSPKDHQVAAQARQYLLTAQLELAQQANDMHRAREAGQGSSGSATADDTPSLSRYDIVTRAAQASGSDSLRS